MKTFECGDRIETTLGNGTFVRYSNGGQSYKVAFTEGVNAGQEFSVGPTAVLNGQEAARVIRQAGSKYAPYEGNEHIFDAPVNLQKNPLLLLEFLQQAQKWVLRVTAAPDSIEIAVSELTVAGLENASDYVRMSSKRSHGVKYDVLFPDPELPNADVELGLYFDFRGRYYQIGRKEFALYVLPLVRVLEIGEKVRAL